MVLDALEHPGPTNLARSGYDCSETRMPGAGEAPPDTYTKMADFSQGERTEREPPLKPYARP